jgi:phospholipase/carboxylesterase
MNQPYLQAVEINPAGPPRACIIWLHGLGADGHDFEPLIPQFGMVEALGVRVILPHAPRRAVTINGGMEMRAWYDISAADLGQVQDREGILASEQQLRALIQREVDSGIPAARIVLAGFSQGGAIVLHTGLRYMQPLAGILALSSYVPLAENLATDAAPANRKVSIMMAHGMQDPVVPVKFALQSRDLLEQLGYDVSWHSYPMQHAVCPEEIGDVRDWLVQRLGPHPA